jgi:murein DD-endopeptidase MepM/ murein hydrolase activator NlpD
MNLKIYKAGGVKTTKAVLRAFAICAMVVLIMHQNTSAGYGAEYGRYEREVDSAQNLESGEYPYYVQENEQTADKTEPELEISADEVEPDNEIQAAETEFELEAELESEYEVEIKAEENEAENEIEPYSREDTEDTYEQEQEQEIVKSETEYIWPVKGTVTSLFGNRQVSVGSSNHKGLDIAAETGSVISAARDGQVVYAQYNSGGYGYLVILQHSDGVSTYYAHCSSLLVSQGEYVTRGQSIALVGSTGISTGSHCHFEIRLDDESVDPLPLLPEM